MIRFSEHRPRVALGMSGGVDSSVSARLLIDQGYDVTGVYLECWRAPGCRSEEDRKDALTVALQLNIPFKVLDFKDAYRDSVVEYFFNEYEAGRTPNPDVMCNKEIKFGLFYDWAMENDFDAIATGHYAQVKKNEVAGKRKLSLVSSTDTWKDQTYFLYRITEEQLHHTVFPIGHLQKKEVRQMAEDFKLPVATKKDSVGICFIGDIDVHQFLKDRLGEKIGNVVDTSGRVIGQHKGLWFYTIGQRHGFTIFPKTVTISADGEEVDHHNIPPFYVIGKDAAKNELIVGFGRETYQQKFFVENFHAISQSLNAVKNKMFVRIRHTGQLHECRFTAETGEVTLQENIQGLAEGQSAVFYTPLENTEEFICLGGGIIANPR